MTGVPSVRKRQAAVALFLSATALIWLSVSFVSPFMIAHHPGDGQWVFVRFLAWQSVPAAIGLSLFLLMRLAVRLWYPAYRKEIQMGLAAALSCAAFLGAVIVAFALNYGK
jgi:hypothetical protein